MKRAYTLVELAIVLSIVGILAAIFVPATTRQQQYRRRSTCQSNMSYGIGLGMLQYAQDHDERFPPASSNAVASSMPPFKRPFGWADAIQPYTKSAPALQCPAEASRASVNAARAGFTDYWLNANLSRLPLRLLSSPTTTLLIGEGNDGRDATNARYNRASFPQAWLSASDSPMSRHGGMANYIFADGHVKGLRPEQMVSGSYRPAFKP